MISFILIGRNEGWKLDRALSAVFSVINNDNISDYEVIYVDSASCDDSVARALSYPGVRIFRITGHCNAAIGRNIGAREARGDTFFFIDGDMELRRGFINLVHNNETGLTQPFVTGTVADRYYEQGNENPADMTLPGIAGKKPSPYKTGGLFMVQRDLWTKTGGMRNEFRVNEDIDFGLRLAGRGIRPVRRPELLAIHNTVPVSDGNRMWKNILSGAEGYRAVVLRKNILNTEAWRFFVRTNYSMPVLAAVVIAAALTANPWWLIPYPAVLAARTAARRDHNPLAFLLRMAYYMYYELAFPLFFLFFHPSRHREEYMAVRKSEPVKKSTE